MTYMPEGTQPQHGVIVLAAGRSQRLGQSKQLLTINGEILLRRSVRHALATDPGDCVVVCGAEGARVAESVVDLNCRVVHCTDHARGLSASLHCGLGALDPACAAALIVLTDQLGLDAAHLCALRDAWRKNPERAIASGYADVAGVPALLPRSWFDALMQSTGDSGARELLRSRRDQVDIIAAPQLELDIDHPSDLERLRSSSAG